MRSRFRDRLGRGRTHRSADRAGPSGCATGVAAHALLLLTSRNCRGARIMAASDHTERARHPRAVLAGAAGRVRAVGVALARHGLGPESLPLGGGRVHHADPVLALGVDPGARVVAAVDPHEELGHRCAWGAGAARERRTVCARRARQRRVGIGRPIRRRPIIRRRRARTLLRRRLARARALSAPCQHEHQSAHPPACFVSSHTRPPRRE